MLIFGKYVDTDHTDLCIQENVKWSTEELFGLKTAFKDFEQRRKRIFDNCQPSDLCTSKFYALHHLVDENFQIASSSFTNLSSYERSHRSFKNCYKKASKRSQSATK